MNRLLVASNANDILSRFFDSGDLSARNVVETLSPSMDIQVSSNLERLCSNCWTATGWPLKRCWKSSAPQATPG